MNTCNYLTPYPVASHKEGGILYSNGVQYVTISPMVGVGSGQPYTKIIVEGSVAGAFAVAMVIVVGVCLLIKVILKK